MSNETNQIINYNMNVFFFYQFSGMINFFIQINNLKNKNLPEFNISQIISSFENAYPSFDSYYNSNLLTASYMLTIKQDGYDFPLIINLIYNVNTKILCYFMPSQFCNYNQPLIGYNYEINEFYLYYLSQWNNIEMLNYI